MPGEAYKRHEFFNRVIYKSAGLTSFKKEKEMSAMRGRETPAGRESYLLKHSTTICCERAFIYCKL